MAKLSTVVVRNLAVYLGGMITALGMYQAITQLHSGISGVRLIGAWLTVAAGIALWLIGTNMPRNRKRPRAVKPS